MQIVRLEDQDHPEDRTLGAILLTFASGRQKTVSWRSERVVNRKEMAQEILLQVIQGLDADHKTREGDIDRREFNPASFLAGLDAVLAEWNGRLLAGPGRVSGGVGGGVPPAL
jgi:hypothetical protein